MELFIACTTHVQYIPAVSLENNPWTFSCWWMVFSILFQVFYLFEWWLSWVCPRSYLFFLWVTFSVFLTFLWFYSQAVLSFFLFPFHHLFLQAKVLSKLSLHPNIISYYDSFEVDGTLMIEMEYADGGCVSLHLSCFLLWLIKLSTFLSFFYLIFETLLKWCHIYCGRQCS